MIKRRSFLKSLSVLIPLPFLKISIENKTDLPLKKNHENKISGEIKSFVIDGQKFDVKSEEIKPEFTNYLFFCDESRLK